jgi:hypothetical protein
MCPSSLCVSLDFEWIVGFNYDTSLGLQTNGINGILVLVITSKQVGDIDGIHTFENSKVFTWLHWNKQKNSTNIIQT